MNLAIVDKNVVDELLSSDGSKAGPEFLKWIVRGDGLLSSGGGNWDELRGHSKAFKRWLDTARRIGWLRLEPEDAVRDETRRLERDKANRVGGACRSNDTQVIALARVGGARLLFTNDGMLQGDFANRELIRDPRGKVYTTRLYRGKHKLRPDKRFSETHRALLARKDLRGEPQVGT